MEYCKTCGEPLQFPPAELFGKTVTMNRQCKCVRDKTERENAERELREKNEKAAKNRSYCFKGNKNACCTFAEDDRDDARISRQMRNYAERFEEIQKSGDGLILLGNVGSGKTFYASCVANALIDKGYRVMFSNLVDLVQRIQNETYNGLEVMEEIKACDLLVIDDLGVERDSAFMQESVYSIINKRYESGKPLIVTTNLTAQDLTNPKTVMCDRIYGRIIEKCFPIEFKGRNRRSSVNRERMKAILNG